MGKSSSPPQESFGNRQLAAILFTDVAGFSRLTEESETRTLRLVQRDLKVIAHVCKEFGGEVLKNTGDGCLVTFRSVEAAVRSALRIQGIIAEAAHRLPPEQILHHRIGIHLGDVFFGQGDVLGNGVNIAARLLGEAEPDGICISQPVYDLVKNRLAVKAVFIGARELKNIRESVPVYRLLIGAAAEEQSEKAATKSPACAGRKKALVAAAIALIVGIGAWFAFRKTSPDVVALSDPVVPATIPASQPTAVPQIIQQILQSPPTFAAGSPAGWQGFPTSVNPNFASAIENGSYVLTVQADAVRVGLSTIPFGVFDDVTIEATGRIVGPPGAFWAISLIAANGPRKVVHIALNDNGVARVDLSRLEGVTGRRGTRPGDVHFYSSASIRKSASFNTLVINIRNHTMTLVVNGDVVGEPLDITSLDRATLSAGIEGGGGTRAEFQKLRMWVPTAP